MLIKDIKIGKPYFCYRQTENAPAIAGQINRIGPRSIEVVLKQPTGASSSRSHP